MIERKSNVRQGYSFLPLISVLLTASPPVSADLTTLEGLNEVQKSVAQGVTDLCSKLNVLSSYSDTEVQLWWACNAFIHTANAIQNSGPTTYSLGLSEQEMVSVLAELAHEETTASGDVFTEISQNAFTTVASRLRGLKRGGIKGAYRYQLQVNDMSFNSHHLSESNDQAVTPFNSPWSYYLNGNFNNGNKAETSREDAFDFQSNGLTLGLDYRVGSSAFVGSAITYSNLDLNIDYKDYDDGTNINSYDLSVYSAYFKGTAYFNALFGFGYNQLENRRYVPSLIGTSITNLSLANSIAVTGYTSAKTMSLSLSGGGDESFGSFSLSYYGQLDMSRVYIDEYNEEGSSPLILHIAEEKIDSLSFSLGTQASHIDSLSFGVVSEFIRLEWRHEFSLESRSIDAYYVYDTFDEKSVFSAPSDKPDADYYSLGTGFTLVLPKGMQLFAYYEKLFDLQYYDNQFFTVGVRAEIF